jgi:hypothetical protein
MVAAASGLVQKVTPLFSSYWVVSDWFETIDLFDQLRVAFDCGLMNLLKRRLPPGDVFSDSPGHCVIEELNKLSQIVTSVCLKVFGSLFSRCEIGRFDSLYVSVTRAAVYGGSSSSQQQQQ